jgi:glycosyltransferase involved in cell wall biosynthesis
VSRLVEGKGHESLLRAFCLALQEYPNATLTIVGDGPLAASLRELAASLGIEHAVSFVGETTDVAPYLSEADVFVHPSESEGMPRSGLEAAFVGLPIVARELPCHSRYLFSGLNGLYFSGGEEPMAHAILTVLAGIDRFTEGARSTRKFLLDDLDEKFRRGLDEVSLWH